MAHSVPVRKRNILAVLIALLALLAAGFLLYNVPNKPGIAQRLPDGSYLRIVHFEYGHNHQYSTPKLKPWQRFLGRHLPAWMTARFGLRGGEQSSGSSARPGESNLVVIVVCEMASSRSFYNPRLRIFDEQGNECGVAWGPSGAYGPSRKLVQWSIEGAPSDKKLSQISGENVRWSTAGPPADKILVLKFSETGPDGLTREVAAFHLPNPAAGKN